jgi:hypothetical protein
MQSTILDHSIKLHIICLILSQYSIQSFLSWSLLAGISGLKDQQNFVSIFVDHCLEDE